MSNLAKLYAQVFGVVLTLVGILGFVPALVTNNNLLGIFTVDPIHNVIHLASGIVGLAAGFSTGTQFARLYAGIFGAVYALVTVIGFIQGTTVLSLIHVNAADNFLHAAIAVVSLGVYFTTGSSAQRTAHA